MKDLTFEEYSDKADTTAKYPCRGANLYYPALGLCGEAGEVAEKIKKIMRDKNGVVSREDKAAIAKELGDVLWYINAVCFELKIPLEGIAQGNIDKLFARVENGTIHGEGDDR